MTTTPEPTTTSSNEDTYRYRTVHPVTTWTDRTPTGREVERCEALEWGGEG